MNIQICFGIFAKEIVTYMYRTLFKNIKNEKEELLWKYSTGEYYKDVSLTQKVDISDYEPVDCSGGVVNIPTPYQLFGVECEKGWYRLLQPIIDYIDNYNKDKNECDMIYITQIKEKYGTLRFYVSIYTKELQDLIEEAEKRSGEICEMCGSDKHVGTTLGWYITICHDCVKKRSEKMNESIKWHSYDDNKVYFINPEGPDEYIETIEEYEEALQ